MALTAQTAFGPVPSKRQLAWHALHYYAFVHFGPNTFTDKEWGTGLEDPKVFAPTDLDTDQWCQVFKEAGMSMVILTAKHHDGFCLWPSKFSTHTVREAGQPDVLKLLSASCKKYGLKLGVYLSPWDRNHPKYGTPEYNGVFIHMLEEVLGGAFGEISEVWFDGANGEGPNGKKQVYDFAKFNQTVRKLQPNAVIFSDAGPDIRWVGNESGIAGETNWCTIDRDRYVPGTPLFAELTEGKMGGKDWVPAECDVSIRKGWFWRASEDSTVKSPETLFDIWLKSVGRGANLLLNVPPDRRGRIADVDIQALNGFRDLRQGFQSRQIMQARNVAPLELEFKPQTVSAVKIEEAIARGQGVATWILSARVNGEYKEVARGTTVGAQRIVQFTPVVADRVLLQITGKQGRSPDVKMAAYRAE
ncbi:MAG: alpha-L-fucosidase [Armatimonadetes bacterium]|nr:alpha-L-fucosidase [Armatimonadota bacterium]MBX3109004.1 alpha-L-fucosidase [Fimbriimonadaceae bacterium]